jgi:hypothetical protein
MHVTVALAPPSLSDVASVSVSFFGAIPSWMAATNPCSAPSAASLTPRLVEEIYKEREPEWQRGAPWLMAWLSNKKVGEEN